MGNRQRKLQRLVNPPPSQREKSKEQELREKSERFEAFSRRHNEEMIEKHGEEWRIKQAALFDEWKHQQELHGENSHEAIIAGQRAAHFRRTGRDRGLR